MASGHISTCPVCGTTCLLVSGDESTSHYSPLPVSRGLVDLAARLAGMHDPAMNPDAVRALRSACDEARLLLGVEA